MTAALVPCASALTTMLPLAVPLTVTVALAELPELVTEVPNVVAPVNEMLFPIASSVGFAVVLIRTVLAPLACPVIP